MNRQDCVAPRTAAQLERQYNFGKAFNEVLGIANDARIVAEEAKKASAEIVEANNGIALRVQSLEQGLSGQFQLTIEEAEDEETGEKKVYSLINGEATEIQFKSNSLIIESDYFELDREGKIYATGGRIGNCYFKDNGDLVIPTSCFAEKITADKLNADNIVATNVDITGKITATEGTIGDCEINADGELVVKKITTETSNAGYYTIIHKDGLKMLNTNENSWTLIQDNVITMADSDAYTYVYPGKITLGCSWGTNAYKSATIFMDDNDGIGALSGSWKFSDQYFYIGDTMLTEAQVKALKNLIS